MVQVNLRVDDDTVAALDELAAREGTTRAQIVREAVRRRLRQAAVDRVAASYQAAYTGDPETADELERAEQTAQRLTDEESWEPWW